MIRIRNQQDFAAGLLFVLIGAIALYGMRDLRMGTAMRMGAAYIPTLAAWGMIGLGLILAATSLLFAGPKLEKWAWGPLALICGSMAFFGLAIPYTGLLPASFGIVLIAGFAARDASWLQVILFAGGISIAAALLFAGLLGLPLRLWPW